MTSQLIFNYSILVYLFLSTAHLVWQFLNIPKEYERLKNQITTALGVNLILLFFNIYLIFFPK
jgi:hypothetical protein